MIIKNIVLRIKIKTFVLILILFTLVYTLFSFNFDSNRISYTHFKLHLKKFVYILNDYVDENFRPQIDENLQKNTWIMNGNASGYCLRPIFDEKLPLAFLNSDLAALQSTFEECDSMKLKLDFHNAVQIKHFFNSTNQKFPFSYSLKLNHKIIRESFELNGK
jgi:hypothetical protein